MNIHSFSEGSSMKKKLAGRVVLVTGASSGIGAALARQAAAWGASVVLAARRRDRIDELAAELPDALAVTCDVTRDGDLERAVQEGLARYGRLDIAIANAGFGVMGTVAELSVDDFRRQLETNFFGVLRTIHATLPALTVTKGAIGIIGSTNGYLSLPRVSAYCVSKHAVRSLAFCLRHEVAARGVSVTHLAPGFIPTEIRQIDNRGVHHPHARDPVPAWLQMPVDKAARQILRAILSRRGEAVITLHSKLAVFVQRHAPWIVSGALRLGRQRVHRTAVAPEST
jgi:short-subunit dehydrogenase